MQLSATEKSYIWLDSFPLEPSEKRKLLEDAGSACKLVKEFPRFADFLIKRGKESVYNNMRQSLEDDGVYFKALLQRYEEKEICPIAYGSLLYPNEWKSFADAPIVLYAKGDTSLLKKRKFAVVGSRSTISSALKLTEKITEELTKEFVVVTGVADGGDSAALQGGLRGKGVICLTAGGFSSLPQGNLELLKRVEKNGLLLSPHSYETPVRAFSYEYRNKLLSALCEGVLVVGAGEKSGALITAKYAKELEKKLFAIPYAPNVYAGVGCNALIQQGAYLTQTAQDIFSIFGIEEITKEELPILSEEEKSLYDLLKTLALAHVTEISEKSGLPMYKASALLSSLEIKGLVVKMGGNNYQIV